MARKHKPRPGTLNSALLLLASSLILSGQTPGPLGYSVATPRPISPAEGTTTPSAQATQRQNPYLGSVPSKNTGARIELSLKGAIERGLRYNLGLIEAIRQVRTCARSACGRSLHCCRNCQRMVARATKTSASKRSV